MARHKLGTTSGKKRKSSTGAKRSRPRRRMSGGGKIETIAMNGVGVAVGIVGIREVSILAGTMAPSLMASPMITGALEIAVGGLLAWKAKNGFLTYAGLGAFGNGIMTVLNGAGIIGAGPQTMSYQYANRRIMGDPRLQFVAGPTTRIGSYPNNFAAVAGAARRKNRYSS